MKKRAQFFVPTSSATNFKAYLYYRNNGSWDLYPPFTPVAIPIPYGNECNAACIFCLRRSAPEEIPDDRDVPLVLDRMKRFIRSAYSVYLSDWGEPAVAAYFGLAVDKLNEWLDKDTTVGYATNGNRFSESMLNLLFDGKPRFIVVSLNAINRTEYRKTVGVDAFEETLANIRTLIDKRRCLSPRVLLTIYVSIVLTAKNFCTLYDFVRLSADLGVQGILVQEFIPFDEKQEEFIIRQPFRPIRDVYLESVAYSAHHNLPIVTVSNSWYLNPDRAPREQFWCQNPWSSFRVKSNGDVAPCCYFMGSCGNVLEQTPEEVWYGKAYVKLRQQWIKHRQIESCAKCMLRWSPHKD